MHSIRFLSSLLLMLCTSLTFSQSKTLSVSAGIGQLSRQDLTFSPFIHSDVSPLQLGIRYDRSALLHHWLQLRFSSYHPSVTEPYTFDADEITFPHSFLLLSLAYGIGKQLNASEAASPVIAGICLDADIQPSTYHYNPFSSFGYYASFSAGIWAKTQFALGHKNKLETSVRFPIAALVARSPYLVNDDAFIENTYSHNGLKTFLAYVEDGNVLTWNKMQQAHVHIQFRHTMSPAWEVGFAYDFSGLHVSQPTSLIQFQHILSLQTTLTL